MIYERQTQHANNPATNSEKMHTDYHEYPLRAMLRQNEQQAD
jgi:hypothetical protein